MPNSSCQVTKALARTEEFSFRCNEKNCAGTNATFELVDPTRPALPNGKSLTIRLRHKQLPLEVSVVYSVYNGHPAIRKHLAFHNTGTSPLHLSHLVSSRSDLRGSGE